MEWNFDENTPIYLQIIEQIKKCIATGELQADEKLPAVRELAVTAGVNPNTMQKALSQLENEGYLYSIRTSGRYVSKQADKSQQLQKELTKQSADAFIENMKRRGYEKDEVVKILADYISGSK